MKDNDKLSSFAKDSQTIKFDCDKLGVRHDDFQLGKDPSRGKYRLISTISNDYDKPSFKEDFKVFSPVDRQYGQFLSKNYEKSSNKAVLLKTLVNTFNVNDIEGGDEVSLSIYSDVVDDMFKCGQYNFRSGDAVDFDNLMIPCRELITVTLTESDGTSSDGHTVFVPCNANSEMTIDLIIPKGNLATIVDKQTSIEKIINFFNTFNPFKETKVGI
jgi:hypothetical protein